MGELAMWFFISSWVMRVMPSRRPRRSYKDGLFACMVMVSITDESMKVGAGPALLYVIDARAASTC